MLLHKRFAVGLDNGDLLCVYGHIQVCEDGICSCVDSLSYGDLISLNDSAVYTSYDSARRMLEVIKNNLGNITIKRVCSRDHGVQILIPDMLRIYEIDTIMKPVL